MKYKEIRTLSEDDLRSLCIRRGWYTNGTSEQYARLFDRLRDKKGYHVNMTADKLAEIAADIMEHSDLRDYDDIVFIMSRLTRECVSIFRRKL